MKKILKYFTLVSLSVLALSACNREEAYDTDQYGTGVAFSAMAPNPVMRGGELRILGNNLDQVASVKFAGDISVTDITVVKAGAHGEIRVLVPMEGPEVGKVSIVTKDGKTYSSFADLEYTEPIEIDSFSPATVLSGDVVTITGEYLNNVQMVFFPGEDVATTEFVSQSRYELKVEVPFNAITGPIILSDVNEWADQSTIPNHIYTATDLVVGDPTVDEAEETTYKSGDLVTVTGAHLDMIKNVALAQVDEVDFTLADDAASLSFNMPAAATDGTIILTSYAGVTFDAGDYKTVTVSDLTIESQAEDGRYKAGNTVKISGGDLDLVTKVEFTGAEASWYYESGDIYATVPDAAKDGVVTLTLDSGKQAYTEEITVVKPEILTWSGVDPYIAGESVVEIEGDDLDLVVSVMMGDKKQGFIDCEFETEIREGATLIKVTVPANAYTSPITLVSAAEYTTETLTLLVDYNMAVSITFDAPSFALGKKISFTGENLLKIETVYIKGNKVTAFDYRTDNAMSFTMPEDITSPGVYRLELVLVDGTEMTWPVPFEITAPFTETFVWQGSQIIAGWSGVGFGDDRFIWEKLGIKVGDVVKLYFTAPETGWWDLQLCNGHWGNLKLDELGGGNEIKQDMGFPGGAQTFSFNVTEEVLASLTEDVGWGNAFIINGDGNVEVTGISLIQYGAVGETIWEGSHLINWGGSDDAHKALTVFSWGGYAAVKDYFKAGAVMELKFERNADEVQIRVSNGSWSALPGTPDPYKLTAGETTLEVELTQAMVDELANAGGLVITGQGLTLTEIIIK